MAVIDCNAFAGLVGLQLTTTYLAADMRIFGFGPRRERPILYGPRKGETGIVGSHALHLQGPWRLRQDNKIVTGRSDLFVFEGDTAPPDWHYEQGNSRQCVICERVVRPAPRVHAVSVVPELGEVSIQFEGDLALDLCPDSTVLEAWRFFEPSGDADHVVFPVEQD